jgi:hypothetical protein
MTAREWAREHGATHFMVDSSVLQVLAAFDHLQWGVRD